MKTSTFLLALAVIVTVGFSTSANARLLTWTDAPPSPGEQITGYAVFETGNDTSVAYILVGQPLEYETGSDAPGSWYLRTVAVNANTPVSVVGSSAALSALVSIPSVVLEIKVVCTVEVLEGSLT